MLVNDIALFCFLFLFQIISFLVLHFIILRLFANKNLLYSSAVTILLSIVILTLLSYFLIFDLFSAIESFALSVIGSGLATIFACGLYTFLGPVTADRSLACHLFILLYNMHQ